MDVMEDGNLMDKVRILIQKDLEYYKDKQSVLQETICPEIIGGKLDFPRNASFAAVKLILWWEDEFVAGFRKPSGLISAKNVRSEDAPDDEETIKASDPEKFVSLVTLSAEQLLDHLHVLTQEALDHADLSVLTGTIGASALIKNALWYYIQSCNENNDSSAGSALQTCFKQYNEMGEALAERLLDLHCRLISLYILQDADCLDWDNGKPFFESERGSYVIQMWWLYMKGTQEDLWNTVPPKMAQMVLSGMLNESLTILTVRYIQLNTSKCRSDLYNTDVSNLLLCVAQLLPSICNNTDELLGFALNAQSKTIRDIQAKCRELFIALILRATPLPILYKTLRKGLDSLEMLKSHSSGPNPWVIFALPHIFAQFPIDANKCADLPDMAAILLELSILVSQPQANWALLLKVLAMRNAKILSTLLQMALARSGSHAAIHENNDSCGGFLCSITSNCKLEPKEQSLSDEYYYSLAQALVHILLIVGNDANWSQILLQAIMVDANWATCLDRGQVWNLNKPSWYQALTATVKDVLDPIQQTVINAVQTGASMYQTMTIAVVCFIQLYDGIPAFLPRVAALIQEALPVEVTPLGNSVLFHVLTGALYAALLQSRGPKSAKVTFASGGEGQTTRTRQTTFDCSAEGFDASNAEEVALAVAEALCSIDEDNKHTEEIEELLRVAERAVADGEVNDGCRRVEDSLQVAEVLVSELLMSAEGKRSVKLVYNFIQNYHVWLLRRLQTQDDSKVERNAATCLLHTMFHIGPHSFDKLLTGEWKPDWSALLRVPMGVSVENARNQIGQRWDLRDVNKAMLSAQEASMTSAISTLFKKT